MNEWHAYHNRKTQGKFSKENSYTNKNINIIKGDKLYIISGQQGNPTEYYLEGIFEVIEKNTDGPFKLPNSETQKNIKFILKTIKTSSTDIILNNEPWFNKDEFRSLFANGFGVTKFNSKSEKHKEYFDFLLGS
ncbi:hypothetical protein [Advenella sp. EE-W14]|uniref:hypothetical protein n=1 Tax=Advenella sp. EE-W14 TaxID=2722705 RepID=UPI00145F134D|nr:hypothetical protein [Advenella sp. EE-W14]